MAAFVDHEEDMDNELTSMEKKTAKLNDKREEARKAYEKYIHAFNAFCKIIIEGTKPELKKLRDRYERKSMLMDFTMIHLPENMGNAMPGQEQQGLVVAEIKVQAAGHDFPIELDQVYAGAGESSK